MTNFHERPIDSNVTGAIILIKLMEVRTNRVESARTEDRVQFHTKSGTLATTTHKLDYHHLSGCGDNNQFNYNYFTQHAAFDERN